MTARILDVTAHTTFDFLDARAVGKDWTDEGVAVLDVTTPREEPGVVRLGIELDHTDLGNVPPHADSVVLSPSEARTLATDLEAYADEADAASADDDGSRTES